MNCFNSSKIEKFLKDSFTKIGMDVDFSKELKSLKGSTLDELKNYVLDRIMNIEPETRKITKLGFL